MPPELNDELLQRIKILDMSTEVQASYKLYEYCLQLRVYVGLESPEENSKSNYEMN